MDVSISARSKIRPMICTADKMPRKRRSYILDERTIDAIATLARSSHTSANRYLEALLFAHGKQTGTIPINAEPLPELRGGDQTKGKSNKDGKNNV